MHTHQDLGSIKFSLMNTSGSTRNKFTCCSSSLARALVISCSIWFDHHFSSLGTFFAAMVWSSLRDEDGKSVGMSSSSTCTVQQ
jgi:hypothetical protein